MAISSNGLAGLKPGVVDNTAARPSSPFEGQAIYQKDTDQVLFYDGSAWVETASMLTKAPRGVMAVATSTTQFNLSATQVVATGMSVTFTAQANRYYRITYSEPELDYAATQGQYIFQRLRLTGVSGTLLNTRVMMNPSAYGTSFATTLVHATTLTAGSITIVGTLFANTGTVSVYRASDFIAQLLVEDIGAA
jgi:hypothetical protein